MKGLLIKDIYTLIKQFKLFFVFIIVFSLVPGYSMSAFVLCYSAMLPITALAYDERSKWGIFAAMMPYSTRSIILSKYLLGYICVAIAAVLSVVGKIGYSVFTHSEISVNALVEILPMLCIATLLQAFNLPFMFKMGVEKGRLLFILTTVIIVIVGMAFSEKITELLQTVNVSLGFLVSVLVLVTIIINVISILISESLYKKREA